MAHDRVDLSDEKGWLPRVWVNGRSTNMASWMASVEDRLSYLASRITAKATSDVPTEGNPTAAQASDSTTRTETPLPLGTAGQENGPAAPSSECVHEPDWDLWGKRNGWYGGVEFSTERTVPNLRVACLKCNAQMLFELTPAPAADTGLSISQSDRLKPYAGAYRSGSAPSLSREPIDDGDYYARLAH